MRFVSLKILAVPTLVVSLALAAEMNGVKAPDQVEVSGKQLVLNGLGLRLATIFHVKVYVGALYLEKKSQDAGAILNSPETKRVVLNFVRDVDAGKIRGAWEEGLEKNCSSGCDSFKKPIEQLQSMMIDFKNGDQMAFDFLDSDRVAIWIRGKQVGTISSKGFSIQLLKDWLGNPPNDELKSGMLGQK